MSYTCALFFSRKVELDSGEFETLSDALQNLLLAPPYQPTRGKRSGKSDDSGAVDAKRSNAEHHVVQVLLHVRVDTMLEQVLLLNEHLIT